MNNLNRLKLVFEKNINCDPRIKELLGLLLSSGTHATISEHPISAQKLFHVWTDRLKCARSDDSIWRSQKFDEILQQDKNLFVSMFDSSADRYILFIGEDDEVIYIGNMPIIEKY